MTHRRSSRDRRPGGAIRSLPFRHNVKPALGFEIFRLSQLYGRAEQRRIDHARDAPQRPEFHTIYLDTFDAAVASSKTSVEAQKKVKAKYPSVQLDIILQLGADAAFPAR